MHKNHKTNYRTANCSAKPDVPVVGGLAHSATEIAQLAAQGLPISSPNFEGQYYDGVPESDAILDPEFSRGYDINQAWDQEMTAKQNIRRGRKAAKAKKEYEETIASLHNTES